MINRDNVALEKTARAVQLLNQKDIDMWVFYSRKKQDPALELMFNTSTQNEVLFVITKNGDIISIGCHEDSKMFAKKGFFTEIITAENDDIISNFMDILKKINPKNIAFNNCKEDTRGDGLGLGLYHKLEKAIGKETLQKLTVSSFSVLEELRAVKTPTEIEIMTETIRITQEIYDELFSQLHVGLSETDVGDIMLKECEKRDVINGIEGCYYPLVLLVKGGMSHRQPNPNNICLPGDMLVIDFSIRYNGYTSDIARTIYFLKDGETKAPKDVQDCVDAVIGAVNAVTENLKPGVVGFDADALGRNSIMNSGYPNIPHSVGHQVGLEVHDGGTSMSTGDKPSNKQTVRENEIYAIEPTVLQKGGLPCAIIEDNWIITSDGCRPISKRQLDVILIPFRG